MKTRMILAMVIALLLVPAVALHAQESDPEAVVEALFAAINAGDVDGVMVFYAEDAVVNIVPFATHTGAEEIRAYMENGVSLNATLEHEVLAVDGDTVSLRVYYTDDDLRGIGVNLEGMEEITIVDGKVVTETWTATDEAMASLQAAMDSLPETGGGALPLYAVVMALGGLVTGGGLAFRRGR